MPQTMTFGPLEISYDERVLRPRPWTVLQGRWAGALLSAAPDGPILELGCGVGHIGLLAVSVARRRLVAVDSSPVACAYARRNATAAGLADLVEVREAAIETALAPEERFALLIADPPWVPTDETGRFPEDPPGAIDGGPDGLDVARAWLRLAGPHLVPRGSVLLQLGSTAQASALESGLEGLAVREVRHGDGGVVVLLTPDSDATMEA